MTKLAYFVAFAFLLSPCLKASDEQEAKPIGRMLYTAKGAVFKDQSYKLCKEVFEGERAQITHRPESKILCLASIEHLDPNVIVHNNYFTRSSPEKAIKSFTLTPNIHNLCVEAPNAGHVCSSVYAKIPVRLDAHASEIELLIFDERDSLERPDYAQTIAHGLQHILCSYIPAAHRNGTLPALETIAIRDRSRALAEILRQADSPLATAIAAQYDLLDFIPTGETPYWTLSYVIKVATTK